MRRIILLGPVAFICLFLYFLKNSRNFRVSVISAFIATSVVVGLALPSYSIDRADAFSAHKPNTNPYAKKLNGRPNANSGGSGSGGSNSCNDNLPQYPKTEPVAETEARLKAMEEKNKKLKELVAAEEEECTRVKTLLQSGSHPTSIGSKSTHLRGNKFLIKGKHGRYLVEMVNDEVSILGVGDRSDMTRFVKLMNNEYDVNLKYKI